MRERAAFWDRCAPVYDRFVRRDAAAYAQMIARMRPAVRDRTVRELATGTGWIAKQLVCQARSVEATDASEAMIRTARLGNDSAKLHFSVQDLFQLPYADESFDVVIAANVLHVIPQPERALREMGRVLRPDGCLIVPTFVHGENRLPEKLRAWAMGLAGFPLCSRWTHTAYLAFLQRCGWSVWSSTLLKAAFPLCYAECVRAACGHMAIRDNAASAAEKAKKDGTPA